MGEFPCIIDYATSGGFGHSGEKVTSNWAACSRCVANRQSGPAFHDMTDTDPQYFCANDTRLGGQCTSGEKVSRARAVCSKCIALGYEITFASDAGIVEVPEGLGYLRRDDYGLDGTVTANPNLWETLSDHANPPGVTLVGSLASQEL